MALAVLQARMSSRRLPGKVLRDLEGAPMLARQIERVRRAADLDLVVATSDRASDDPVAALCRELDVDCHRGSLDDVLARVLDAVDGRPGDPLVRLTGDCPLTDPTLIEDVVARHLDRGADYSSNVLERHLPDGLDVEVVEREALREAAAASRDPADREHVTRFIWRQPERFRLHAVRQAHEELAALRWTVDHEEDLRFVRQVYRALYPVRPHFGWRDVLALVAGQSARGDDLEVSA